MYKWSDTARIEDNTPRQQAHPTNLFSIRKEQFTSSYLIHGLLPD
jgi:hypothetical protein